MQLFEHRFELFGDRQAEVGCVLQNGETVICNRSEDNSGTQDTGLVQDVDIQDLGDTHLQESQHLAAESSDNQSGKSHLWNAPTLLSA